MVALNHVVQLVEAIGTASLATVEAAHIAVESFDSCLGDSLAVAEEDIVLRELCAAAFLAFRP